MVNSVEGALNSSKKETVIFVTENEVSTSTEGSLICVNRLSSSMEETLNNNFQDETLSDSSKKVTIADNPLDLMIVPDHNITVWDLDSPESELFKSFSSSLLTLSLPTKENLTSVRGKLCNLDHCVI